MGHLVGTREKDVLVWLMSAPLERRRSTILSLSLTLAAIMRGVQPLSSWTSGSKPFCCTSREKMSKLLAEAAQWMGSRPSSSFNLASFGSAYFPNLGQFPVG